MQQVNEITKLCTDDFEWYLELWPIYYKAVYYLAKINMKIDDSKCRALLLQLPRKANDASAAAAPTAAIGAEKRLSLFDVHRNRQLFKVTKSNTHENTPTTCWLRAEARVWVGGWKREREREDFSPTCPCHGVYCLFFNSIGIFLTRKFFSSRVFCNR